MSWLYNLVISIWMLINIPRVLFIEKLRRHIPDYFGLRIPEIRKRKNNAMRIWIHAVSLGETRAIIPFIDTVRESLPDVQIFLSSGTETGHREALNMGGKIEGCFYLPKDLPFITNKIVNLIDPDLFVLVESDYWYNLFNCLKKRGTKIAVLNARVSEPSYKAYKRIRPFSKKLFSLVDLYCAQSEEYSNRFLSLGVPKEKVHITGNIKFDSKQMVGNAFDLHFPPNRKFVTVASTHDNEEEMIIDSLKAFGRSICILLAPRHPERFKVVAQLLEKKGIPFRSVCSDSTENEELILVDKMGVLDHCYKVSTVVIMGGSFVKHVGGHNIYEPVRFGIPVIYGPHMHNQEMLVRSLQKHSVGSQVEIANLPETLQEYISDKKEIGDYLGLKSEMEGATERCWNLVKAL